jgi:polyhydroxyalkanoate synthase
MPGRKVHATGYCLGGTLLAIAAAAMARDNDDRLKSITLLAAQTDFSEAGELMLFINESQLAFLDDMMWEQGFLDTAQMAGAFQMLRSNDLVWSYSARNYLMGEREPMSDLMAWNADATRMPYKMHSQYLHKLFLNNDLAEGHYMVGDKPVSLSDIRVPVFTVGTERDHVAPWRSTYKIHRLTETEVTYLLSSGGHNVGIISDRHRPDRTYRIATTPGDALHVDPDTWLAATPVKTGSWWPEWLAWLQARSGAPLPPPAFPASDGPLVPAPGHYVLQV